MTRTEHSRRHLRYDVEGIQGNFLFTIGVDVRNLSIAGMALETARALNVGRRYTFHISSGDETLRLPGRVMWCVLGSGRRQDRGEVRPVYQAGVKFEDVINETAGNLLHLIEENAVLDVEQRVFGRFHPGTAAVSMNSDHEFTVRRISISGMLVDLRGVDHDFTRVGTILPLELDLAGTRFTGSGRIAFIDNDSGRGRLAGRTELGIEFVDASIVQRTVLEQFVSSVVEGKALEA